MTPLASISIFAALQAELVRIVILAVVMLIVALVQRGTTGRYLAAIRGSQTGAASLGISLTRAKLTV